MSAVEAAAERVEDQELGAFAHLGGDRGIVQPRDELGHAARVRIGHCYSIRIPPSRMTFFNLNNSVLMCEANSSGVPPITSAPSAARRSPTSGWRIALLISAFSLVTIAAGVPAGARIPYHEPASYPGSPDSASVGTSGSNAERFFPVTASARSLPALMCGRIATMVPNMSWTSPLSRSTIAGDTPLYGTCTIRTPAIDS